MSLDPTVSNANLYRTVFENERVRVVDYRDQPGDKTTPHEHPDSVMCVLSSFERRLFANGKSVDVVLDAGSVRWLDAQEHSGENIGATDTHVIFIELKEPPPAGGSGEAVLGPISG